MPNDPRTIKLGWDQPLDIVWDFQLPLLRAEIKSFAPGKGGALASAFDSPDTAVVNEAGNVIDITVGKQHRAWPYAAIQEYGGIIPPFDIRAAQRSFRRTQTDIRAGRTINEKRMGMFERRWYRGYKPVMVAWIGGALRFFTKRGPIVIIGREYVRQGVFSWWAKLTRGLTRQGKVVDWATGHYGAGAQRLASKRGVVSR